MVVNAPLTALLTALPTMKTKETSFEKQTLFLTFILIAPLISTIIYNKNSIPINQ